MIQRCNNVSELPGVAQGLLAFGRGRRIYALYGGLGSGKTTLVKALCRELNVIDEICSPTFAIIHEYRDGGDHPLYHMDFYRISDLQEARETGCEEYFDSGNYCFIEWPQKIDNLLPAGCVKVVLTEKEGAREFIVSD